MTEWRDLWEWEGRMRARDSGEWRRQWNGISNKKGKQKSTTGIGTSLTPDLRDKNGSNSSIIYSTVRATLLDSLAVAHFLLHVYWTVQATLLDSLAVAQFLLHVYWTVQATLLDSLAVAQFLLPMYVGNICLLITINLALVVDVGEKATLSHTTEGINFTEYKVFCKIIPTQIICTTRSIYIPIFFFQRSLCWQ